MRLNLARLNHVLLPASKAERDRFRRSPLARLLAPLAWLYGALSEEGRFVVVTSIVVGALGLEVQTTQIYVLWCALVGLAAASLAVRPAFSLRRGVRLELDVPRRVTVGEPVRFDVSLINDAATAFDRVRVRGPMLPWDGVYLGGRPADRPLSPGGRVRFTVLAAFSQRGEHHLDPFVAHALAPLGLAQGAGLSGEGCRTMIVPRVADVRSLRTPRAERHQPGGVALASKTGESMELLGVRPYRPGDPLRDLHARSSARLGAPIVREYQQEYFSRFGVVVDTDAAADPSALEAALSLAAGVVAHLSRGEALIDLLVVGGHLHPLTLGRSLGYLEQALDLLACVSPGDPPDAATLLPRLEPHLARLSCVVVIALGWDEPRRSFVDQLGRRVPCRTLLVKGARGDELVPHGSGITSLGADDVLRGGALSL